MELESKITFKIDTESPLSVESFSKALISFSDEFTTFSENNATLQIAEIRKGSYEIDFIANVTAVMPLFLSSADILNTTIEFGKHIKNITNFLTGGTIKDRTPSKKSIENVLNITKPIVNINGDINIIVGNETDYIENAIAEAANKNAPAILKTLSVEETKANENQTIYKKVLFYWNQTGFNKEKPNTGNKGIIEAINEKPISVIFEDDNSETKREMTTSFDSIDWQERGYIVDIEVLKKDDKIIKYKIIQNYMHESVVDDEEQIDLF